MQNKHHSHHFQNSWNKYSPQNFKFYFWEEVNLNSFNNKQEKENKLREKEQEYFDIYFPFGERGYNEIKQAKGGRGVVTLDYLKQGKAKLSYEIFCEIIWRLCNTNESLGTIAKKVGINK